MRALRTTAFAALVLGLAVLLALLAWEPFAAIAPQAPPQRDYRAEIVRDAWGVPHIHGATDADVAFGVAWAHAEDDFATLQDVAAMTRGRYGALAGAAGASTDYALHLLDARGTVERRYPALPGEVRALLEAYAAGLNRYAAAHPGQVKLARLFPVDGRDIAAGFALRSPFFFGIDKVIGPLVEGKPPPREHGPRLDGKVAPLTPAGEFEESKRPGPLPTGEDAALAGSNAFAVRPDRSGDGVTRLVSNTHQPWRGGTAWYELTVHSDEGWHFAGATFPGSPFPFLGHNETLGWTNTVNRPDLVDIYKLVLDADGTHYRLDGKWLSLEERAVLLPVRFGPLTLPVTRAVYRSAHGPVIVNANGAFAIRYAGIDRLDQLVAYYRLNKARDYAEWEAALRPLGVPSTNFIYADRVGNIAMIYNAAFPERAQGADWRGVLPGDRSELIWQKNAAFEALPQYINPRSGYVFNANNTPFLAAGADDDLDPAGTSPLLGVELDLTNRAVRANRLLREAQRLDRPALERIKYDTGYERSGYVARLLDGIAALDLRQEPELQRAQALLASWDMTADGRGAADALAVMVLKDAGSANYNLRDPQKPRQALAEAAEHLVRHFGRLDPPLGTVLRLRQGKVDLPMDGGSDTLRAATSWDVHDDGRLSVRHGDSFLMFVEWAPGAPVRSQSIVPFGGATTRPRSVHFADQAPLFVRHQLKPVHFERADVLAHAVRRYVVRNR